MPEVSLVVLGSGAVGKSCISIQFVQGRFIEHYDSTIEEIYRKPCSVDGETAIISLVDTAGQDAFATMRENYMRSGQAFILVFSLTDPESLHKLRNIYEQLVRVRRAENTHIPCVVVGNKVDLASQRLVSPDQGKAFARLANCHYFEITAKDKEQVCEVFHHIVRIVRRGSAVPINDGNSNNNTQQQPDNKAMASQQQQQQGGGMNNNNNNQVDNRTGSSSSSSVKPTPAKPKKSFFEKCSIG